MKWKDLTFKEKYQIYSNLKSNNPNVNFFDIEEVFDSIPAYEDGGKNSQEDQAWKINETVRLAMEGKGANQDSLQHIIDRANIQNAPKPYNPSVGAIEQGKQVLSGLNKTVGTALTGASLLTSGAYNLMNLLKVGKGSDYRLWAAKNALTGAKAGLISDIGNFVENPTVENSIQVGLSKAGAKDFTKTSNKIVNNLSTTLDLYDSVPSYRDGGKDKNVLVLPKELGLTPGTPEYLERQKRISGAVNVVQPEAYVTPAGYIKDAMNFVEDLREGDYINAGIDAALNLIPWGVGKTLKKVKNKITKTNNVSQELNSYGEFNPTPTVTKKGRKSKINRPTEEAEASETIRLSNNRRKYESEISKTIEDAVFPDKNTYDLLNYVDDTYGTNYKNAYSNIAMRDMTNRGKYLSWGTNAKDSYGTVRLKSDADGNTSRSIQDYLMILNPDTYMTGTANHELGHIADGLAGSKQLIRDGNIYTTNKYLNYLANESGAMSEGQLHKLGLHGAASNRNYLLNPTEAKSHMLTLKRALKESGEINNWSSPVTEDMLFKYFNSGNSNKMVKYQYDLYNNKQDYVDRLNKLIPMEILMPAGGVGLMNYESNNK